MPPEPIAEPTLLTAPGAPGVDRRTGSLRAELLHRHLEARLASARAELRRREEAALPPDELVARFGATVADAQRTLAAERAAAEAASCALLHGAQARATQLVADAEAEARALRAVATWLRHEPMPVLGRPSDPSAAAASDVAAALIGVAS